jgi:hypothetical protein
VFASWYGGCDDMMRFYNNKPKPAANRKMIFHVIYMPFIGLHFFRLKDLASGFKRPLLVSILVKINDDNFQSFDRCGRLYLNNYGHVVLSFQKVGVFSSKFIHLKVLFGIYLPLNWLSFAYIFRLY